MGYELGVDLGTTYTAAAIHRDGSAQIVELGNRAASIPSVVFLTEQNEILTGDAANRRAVTEPGRVAREFKRRIGDPTPILLGGSPYSAESLSARLLEWVIGRVTEREGERPSRIAVTHPANWGPFKLDLLHQAFRLANLDQVVTLTEPEAAAIHYSTLERIEPGMTVGVFDLGGGTFDAAILRKKAQGFDFLGEPEGIERLGGIDFDAAVFGFVHQSLGDAFDQLDGNDPAALSAVSRLRRDCVEAKEALSSDTETTIPVVLPGVHTDLRLTRAELEQMVRPSLADSIGAMQRAIRSASLEVDEIDVILLVGGSSRIPLVSQMVRSELGRPVAVDAHPKHSVALGAAWAAAPSGVDHLATATIVASPDLPASAAEASGGGAAAGAGAAGAGAAGVGAAGAGAAGVGAGAAGGAAGAGAAGAGGAGAAGGGAAAGAGGAGAAAVGGAQLPSTQPPAEAAPAQPVTAQPTEAAALAGQAPGVDGPPTAPTQQPATPATAQPATTQQPATPATAPPDQATQAAAVQSPSTQPPATQPPATQPPASQPTTSETAQPFGYAAGAAGAVAGAAGGGAVTSGVGGGDATAGSSHGSGGDEPMGLSTPGQGGSSGGGSRTLLLVGIGALVAVLIIGGIAAAQLGGGDDNEVAGVAESEATDADPSDADDADADADGADTDADSDSDESDPDETDGEDEDDEGESETTTTTAEVTTTTVFECAGLCTHVETVQVLDNGELLIYWDPVNFTGAPALDNNHAHFFYDIYEPEQVGSNAAQLGFEQGNWQLTSETPFDTTGTNVSVANAPAGATQICVVAADSGHGVINPENAECFDLP